MRILFKDARILKMDDTPLFRGNLLVIDDKISYIGDESNFEVDRVIECRGNVIMPGFKNAHAHSAMTFVRSVYDKYNLQQWLFDYIIPSEEFLTPQRVTDLAKVAYLEYLTSGITACFEQYYFPLASAEAAYQIGMRVVLLGTYNGTERVVETLSGYYHQFNDKDNLVRYCVGIHAEYTVSDLELSLINDTIHTLKCPFYTHISETAKEVEECKQRHNGMSPVEYFASQGLYDYGGGAYHCIHFSDKDIEIFRDMNLSVVTCPGSNSKLASGVPSIRKYVDEGINVAIGTDGPASNNCLDMFKEMMLVFSLSKLKEKDPTSLQAYDVLKMATVNGAKAMGLNDCDILEIGKKADIIMIDLMRPNMQPINNIVDNIVYSGSKENIKLTMINGKILYEDGKFYVNEPIENIYKACQEASDSIHKEYKASKGL